MERYDVNLRVADLSDLSLLRRWDAKSHVITAKGADGEDTSDSYWETELARHPVWRELLVAETDNRAIGLVQIIDPAQEETHYWGDVERNLRAIDVWIGEEKDLGRGYGSQMMRLATAHCFASQHVVSVLVDPLISNERAGFVTLSGSVAVNIASDRRHTVADAAAQMQKEPARSSLKCRRRRR